MSKARIAGLHLRLGLLSWAVPVAAVGAAWADWHEPGRAQGLLTGEALAVVAWPLVLVVVLYGLPAIPAALVPRRTRKWWRSGYRARPSVPRWLVRGVMAADRRRCCYCHARWQLQVDHHFPYSLGGLTALWNLFVLCGPCNRVKSNYWRFRSGHVVYRSWEGSDDARLAAAILAHERRARWNLLRWLRAAYALGVI